MITRLQGKSNPISFIENGLGMKVIQALKVAAIKIHRTVPKKDTYFQMITNNLIYLGLI
jgi:hypothetical protein